VVVAGIYLVDVDHAVVVGAGIGGLAASLALSRVAARVTLVERAERPSEVGAALALQPNGMAVLDRLGLLLAVEAVSARIDRMDIRSVTGQRLLSARMPDLGDGLDHAIAVRRVELHRLLLEAVAGVASIDTRFGWTAVSADPSGAVMITSTAENGPDFGSMSPAGRCRCGCRRGQFGRAQHGWLREPGVISEQLRTHDCEGSG
jgi:2-polyprenyl-6-methoxyphenol hydroxylase-like FAD-dependent oxidoreductase